MKENKISELTRLLRQVVAQSNVAINAENQNVENHIEKGNIIHYSSLIIMSSV